MATHRFGRTTPASRRALLAGLALGGSSVLAGCTTQYLPPPAPIVESVDCLASLPGWADLDSATPPPKLPGSVPEGFVPVDVIVCTQDYSEAGGAPQALVRQQHLAGDYAELLTAFAQPSARGPGPCTADMEIVPGLWLVNADGGAVNAAWPTDGCGKTRGRPDTAKALAGLKEGRVEVTLLPGAGPAPQPGPAPATSLLQDGSP